MSVIIYLIETNEFHFPTVARNSQRDQHHWRTSLHDRRSVGGLPEDPVRGHEAWWWTQESPHADRSREARGNVPAGGHLRDPRPHEATGEQGLYAARSAGGAVPHSGRQREQQLVGTVDRQGDVQRRRSQFGRFPQADPQLDRCKYREHLRYRKIA